MLNNYLQILENSRVVIAEKREINEFYNHPSILLGDNFHTVPTGKKNRKIVQKSIELRKQIRVEETEAAGNLYEGSSKEEPH